MTDKIIHSSGLLWSIGILVASVVVGLIVHKILFWILSSVTKKTSSVYDDFIVRHSRGPSSFLIPVISVLLVMPLFHLPPQIHSAIKHILSLAIIAGISWFLIGMTEVLSDVIDTKYQIKVKDDLTARRVLTQVQVLKRITVVVIIIITISVMLMTFPEIRSIGAGLFASAGVAGLIIGIAAQSTLSNLIAGIQIALTQPIRINDIVIIEGEWGWIEEIGVTYVVVRIWDLRRLVVPLAYFITKPFQNWTRQSADLLGTVFFYVDYTIPVGEVRNKLYEILQSSNLWDGRTWGLQVTNTTEHTVELRALMSAADSSALWNLRCEVREKMIQYLQEKHPDALPKTRAEIQQAK
ncbi:MAG: mechanosensitive ion channel family protein [bacterium]